MSQTELHVLNTPDDLFHEAARQFATLARNALQTKGKFCVALSGGSTPKSLYTLLASGSISDIPWDKIYFFFGDERHVPPDHPESNYRMANEALLSKIPQPHVFRVPAEEKDADAAARAYEQTIRSFFNLKPGEIPRLDLILLGLGPDGHTASLFPGSAALEERNHLVVANWVEKFNTHRITMTLPVLNHAACDMFLVSGADKAAIVHEVLENPQADLPSQKVRPEDGRLVWLLDRAAAGSLSRRTSPPS
jgi:6-phosphogluconolactonase